MNAKVLVDDMLLKSKHQSANALVVIAGASCTLDALSYCMQVLICMQVTIQPSYNFVYSRTVGVGMYTEDFVVQ